MTAPAGCLLPPYVPNTLTVKLEPVWMSPATVTLAAGIVKDAVYRP